MIVCKRCGNHNPPGDDFCGSCGAFLEWEGEQIVTEQAVAAPVALPPPTLLERIKHAVTGGPDGTAYSVAASDAGSLAPPSGRGTARTPGSALPAPDSVERSMATRLPNETEQPTARAPEAAPDRPKPKVTQPATRQVNPGDLVCGSCGEPNTPPRQFCRRCGTSLAEVVPIKRGWWQRRGRAALPAAGVPAGTRPGLDGSRRGGAGRGARRAAGTAKGGLNSARRVLALLAILGIGAGMAIPSWRSAITDKAGDTLDWVKRKFNPQFAQVSPDPALTAASSAVPGHEAAMVADGASNTFWVADPGDQAATATVAFTPPTKLSNLLITPGDQEKKENFKAQPRPKDLFVEAFDRDGTSVKSAQLSLEDKIDPQKVGFSASNVATLRVTVQSCYPDPSLRVCPITEIEFFKQK